jgi:hypothetical protein
MSEEKESPKNKKLGIVALATAVLSWGCMLGYIPSGVWLFFPLLVVSAVTSVLSRKTALGKVAIVLLILEIPAYFVVHTIVVGPQVPLSVS